MQILQNQIVHGVDGNHHGTGEDCQEKDADILADDICQRMRHGIPPVCQCGVIRLHICTDMVFFPDNQLNQNRLQRKADHHGQPDCVDGEALQNQDDGYDGADNFAGNQQGQGNVGLLIGHQKNSAGNAKQIFHQGARTDDHHQQGDIPPAELIPHHVGIHHGQHNHVSHQSQRHLAHKQLVGLQHSADLVIVPIRQCLVNGHPGGACHPQGEYGDIAQKPDNGLDHAVIG